MKTTHALLSFGLLALAPLAACGDDDTGGGSPAGTSLALTVDNQSSVALADISVGWAFYTEAAGIYVPAPKIGAAASQTLAIDPAAMLAKLEASQLGAGGLGIGLLVAFRDPDHDGVFTSPDDLVGVSQDVAAYFIGKNWDCAEDDLFADDENNVGFECAVGVQLGRITVKAVCAEDPENGGDCGCETHDTVVAIDTLPSSLAATIHAFDDIPCGASPNLD